MPTCMRPDREGGGSTRIHRTTTYGVSLLNPIVIFCNPNGFHFIGHDAVAEGWRQIFGAGGKIDIGMTNDRVFRLLIAWHGSLAMSAIVVSTHPKRIGLTIPAQVSAQPICLRILTASGR